MRRWADDKIEKFVKQQLSGWECFRRDTDNPDGNEAVWFNLRPKTNRGGNWFERRAEVIEAAIKLYKKLNADGIFKDDFDPNNYTVNYAENRTKVDMNSTIESLLELLKANLNIVLTGAPGTGKTYTARKVAEKLVTDGLSETEKAKAKEKRIKSVQFHPGYDYSDFVIGIKPVLPDENNNVLKAGDKVEGKAQVAFRWQNGIFKDFADNAKSDLGNKYVFLIDEINRADLSRVFGELFSLLEEEYRYPNRENGITLPNGEEFVIPMNLYIIGTMNDIDRSVESMDFALRRRFAWFEVKAEDTAAAILNAEEQSGNPKISGEKADLLQEAMKELNKVIGGEKLTLKEGKGTSQDYDLHLGHEYQLGGAIFAKFEKYKDDAEGFKKLWDNHILNILSEYLRGRHDRDALLKGLENMYIKAVGIATDENGSGKQSVEGRENKAGQG